jgi:hypothetical protein
VGARVGDADGRDETVGTIGEVGDEVDTLETVGKLV